ncbi:MAG: SAM-dependent methyltransferase [Myxococcota bacterium]|nr:SAM-dependent methyltransferase [Myxococcota bacterium]
MNRVFEVLASLRDIIEERPLSPVPPPWCEARGWTEALLRLSDEQVAHCEEHGLAACLPELAGAPSDLVELGRNVLELTVVPAWSGPTSGAGRREKLVAQRKLAQIDRLVEHARELAASSNRIVDFGCGRGHLTRLSAASWDKPAVGLEYDEALVHTASALAKGFRATYVRCDARRQRPKLQPDDLAVGLHACGELGDLLVELSAKAGAKVLLVSCCPQKRAASVREPLSMAARHYGLRFEREVLGLANLTHRRECLAAPLAEVQAARERRYAVGLLLRARGHEHSAVRPMRGLSRRFSYLDLATLATAALARCGDTPPTQGELSKVQARAKVEHAVLRRLGLPRNMLSRLLELGVVLDRAACLAEAGCEVRVAAAFDTEVSPRNLVLLSQLSGTSVLPW